jgi:hypothetical protein
MSTWRPATTHTSQSQRPRSSNLFSLPRPETHPPPLRLPDRRRAVLPRAERSPFHTSFLPFLQVLSHVFLPSILSLVLHASDGALAPPPMILPMFWLLLMLARLRCTIGHLLPSPTIFRPYSPPMLAMLVQHLRAPSLRSSSLLPPIPFIPARHS